MRKILSTVLLCLLLALPTMAETYEVVRFTNAGITIGGKKITKGMVFDDKAGIAWPHSDKALIIECKNRTSGELCRYTDVQFNANKARSIAEFYLRINKASTRETGTEAIAFTESPRSAEYPEKRIALVIGNSNYRAQSYLRNAASDASEVQKKLENLGFDVMSGYDCTYAHMRTLLNNFAYKAQGYGAALIYYSGHGVQNKDQNYLVPIDNPLEMESNLNQCVGAIDFVSCLEETGCDTKIVFFDACRDVHTSWRRSGTRGLASMEGMPGMVIVFSTQNGKTAADGEGDYSPFAQALLDNIESNASFSDMMNNVVRQTYNATNRVQYPVTIGNLMSGFVFNAQGRPLQQVALQPKAAPATAPAAPIAQAAPPRPKVDIQFNNPNVQFELVSARRTGMNVILKLRVSNHSRVALTPIIVDEEHLNGYSQNKTMAYDADGNVYKLKDNKMSCRFADISSYEFMLPPGVSMQMEITVKGVPEETEILPLVLVAFRDFGTSDPYGASLLTMRKVPCNYEGKVSTPDPAAIKTSVLFDSPNVVAKLVEVKRSGANVVLKVRLTNQSQKTLTPILVDEEHLNGFPQNKTLVYGLDGLVRNRRDRDLALTVGGENGYSFSLPQDIPVVMTLTIKDIPETDRMLPYVSVAFRDLDTSEPYGAGLMVLKNVIIP